MNIYIGVLSTQNQERMFTASAPNRETFTVVETNLMLSALLLRDNGHEHFARNSWYHVPPYPLRVPCGTH